MEFVGDCARCVGLCCVALERTRAGGFGADIPAGTPCPNLADDHRCRIHDRLRAEGWPSCTVFDCFGAGQQVVQVTFGGDADWRSDPSIRPALFGACATMRHLMEVARLLSEARDLATGTLRDQVATLLDEVTRLVNGTADEVAVANVNTLRAQAGPLLGQVSEQHRHPAPRSRRFVPRASLMGADLRRADLDRQCLRSALLIAADLRGARLDRTDLLGADLRDADLRGADLSGAIFCTQQQVDAARGDATTCLPAGLRHPSHWG